MSCHALKSAIWPRPIRSPTKGGAPLSCRIPRLVMAYLGPEPPPMMQDHPFWPRRAALGALSKLTAVVTTTTLAFAPAAAPAQQNKGPKVLRDTEIEQLLRDYTK